MPPTEASQASPAEIAAAGPPPLPWRVEEDGPPAADPARCANCAAALQGPYCAHCGQHVADHHRSLWRFMGEFLDNTFCWDNKALRTLGPLLTRPGVLTREFMAGRRVRYVQPLRLFLSVSAICLTLLQFHHARTVKLHLGPGDGQKHKHGVEPAASPEPSAAPKPTAASEGDADAADVGDAGDGKDAPGDAQALAGKIRQDAVAGKHQEDFGDRIERTVEARVAAAGGEERFGREMANNIRQKLSWVALAMLPLFALLLRMVYWRRGRYYFEHLIFSLHYHTFLLLFWTLFTGWEVVTNATFLLRWLSPLNVALILVPGVYLYAALRQVYGGRPRQTLVRVAVIGVVHLLTLLIGVASAGALAVFMAGG